MKAQVARLALTVALFAGWLGYLAYQVATRPVLNGWPLVLSRPQLLASELDVIAEVDDTSGEATVVEVLYPPEGAPVKEGDKIQVTNLADCKPLPRPDRLEHPPPDWSGPGTYLLPLRAAPDKKKYEVAAIPPSPGFSTALGVEVVRIYPATEMARAQYNHIADARKKALDSEWWKRADAKE